jgi:membrane protein required for colicin V production
VVSGESLPVGLQGLLQSTLGVPSLNWIDAAVVATLVWFTYAAFRAGLIRELVTIAGAVLAVLLAGMFYTELAKDVDVALNDSETSRYVAFAIIFGATLLGSQLIAMFLKQAASMLMLGFVDSLGGAAFGFLKGLVLAEIFLIFAIAFPTFGLADDVEQSTVAPFFLDVVPFLQYLLPQEFEDAIDSFSQATEAFSLGSGWQVRQ